MLRQLTIPAIPRNYELCLESLDLEAMKALVIAQHERYTLTRSQSRQELPASHGLQFANYLYGFLQVMNNALSVISAMNLDKLKPAFMARR